MAVIRLTKEFSFEAAHALDGYDGPCREIHGHSYRLFVTVKGTPAEDASNPKCGMVLDFGVLKRIVSEEIVSHFDHALVLRASESGEEFFRVLAERFGNVVTVGYQPTCENMLADFAARIAPTACRHPLPSMSPPSRSRAHRPPIAPTVRRHPHRAPSLSSRCGGPRALAGKNRAVCIPFSPNARKRPPSWQHPPEMHAFRDQNGNILAPCIHSRVQSGDSGYMARESCRQGPFFASRNPKSRMARRCCRRRPAFPR